MIKLTATNAGNTISRTLPITYEASDTSQPIPTPPTTNVDKSSSYYWLYNVNDWVDMLNTTLINITIQLNNALATSLTAPYILYDLTTGLFTLYVSQLAMANNIFTIFF